MVRLIAVAAALVFGSCTHIERNTSQMTRTEIIDHSTHLFIGVIERQEFKNRLLFQVSGKGGENWRVLDMTVRVENVLRGTESHPLIDIYEAWPPGLLSGDWNVTRVRTRYLFPVRLDGGRYRLVQDFWRSVYPIYSGRHTRLPLDESRSLEERFTLLQWWVQADYAPAFGQMMQFVQSDPARRLGKWRTAKILRGLLRHPDGRVRLAACDDLLMMNAAQDECWESLSASDKRELNRFRPANGIEDLWRQNRDFERRARENWKSNPASSAYDLDELRLLTAINNAELRREFCGEFKRRVPRDADNGCPASLPLPATIVTTEGDVPLTGAWPNH